MPEMEEDNEHENIKIFAKMVSDLVIDEIKQELADDIKKIKKDLKKLKKLSKKCKKNKNKKTNKSGTKKTNKIK